MSPEAKQKIESAIADNKVMLFMKGTADFPQCGFSARTVQCLQAVGANFGVIDVLADPEVREGIKEFSQWPTIPQLYISGEFVGGCDITFEMFQNGELEKLVAQAQV